MSDLPQRLQPMCKSLSALKAEAPDFQLPRWPGRPRTQDTTFRPFAHAICLDREAGMATGLASRIPIFASGRLADHQNRRRSPCYLAAGASGPKCVHGTV